jgi:hypothetical protein
VLLSDARLAELFPRLSATDYPKTSDPTDKYNCIAWAAGRNEAWWEPAEVACGYYWPADIPQNYDAESTAILFEKLGFVRCGQDATPENGFEKVAIYADNGESMHAARQLESGKWTSKLGKHQDIEHSSADALTGTEYGTVFIILTRLRQSIS